MELDQQRAEIAHRAAEPVDHPAERVGFAARSARSRPTRERRQ